MASRRSLFVSVALVSSIAASITTAIFVKQRPAPAIIAEAITESPISAAIASSGTPGVGPNIFVDLARKMIPSVVNIQTATVVKTPFEGPGSPEDPMRRFFEEFFGRGGNGPAPKSMSLGTGFIIEENGLILTNNHVVQNADEVKVQFSEDEGDIVSAKVVGKDPELDLALLKVDTKKKLFPVALGDSDKLEVGEYVMAVGNPFGHGHSVTHGIVSAKDRKTEGLFARYIQTDASINPGNSGGPLVNLRGEVVGVNNAIDARAHGIGFAIPMNAIKAVLPQLKNRGSVQRGYIGVLIRELTPEIAEQLNAPNDLKAPFVDHVYPGQPADKAGLKPYDLIVEVNGKKMRTSSELIEVVSSVAVGESLQVKVWRSGKNLDFKVTAIERPSQRVASHEGPTLKKPKLKKSPDIGLQVDDLTPELAREYGISHRDGVIVTGLAYGGPAARAGVAQGDVIVEVNRESVKTAEQFYSKIKEKKSNLIRVRRSDSQGQDIFTVIVLDLRNN